MALTSKNKHLFCSCTSCNFSPQYDLVCLLVWLVCCLFVCLFVVCIFVVFLLVWVLFVGWLVGFYFPLMDQPLKMHVLVELKELLMFSFQLLCGTRVRYRCLILLLTEKSLIISLNPYHYSFECRHEPHIHLSNAQCEALAVSSVEKTFFNCKELPQDIRCKSHLPQYHSSFKMNTAANCITPLFLIDKMLMHSNVSLKAKEV